MSDWLKSIWVNRDGAEASKTCDPYEIEDARYVHEDVHNKVAEELTSWRNIATRLIQERGSSNASTD